MLGQTRYITITILMSTSPAYIVLQESLVKALMCPNLASALMYWITSETRRSGFEERVIHSICKAAGTIPTYFLPYSIVMVSRLLSTNVFVLIVWFRGWQIWTIFPPAFTSQISYQRISTEKNSKIFRRRLTDSGALADPRILSYLEKLWKAAESFTNSASEWDEQ